MTVAFLFPGQGMELPRMGLELAAQSPAAAALLEWASELTALDVVQALRRNSRELRRTAILQPTLVAVSLGAYRALRERGVTPDWVAGHSLGEISAWAAAGGIDERDAIALAFHRGRLMERQAERIPGSMWAIAADDEETVRRACEAHAVELAAHNAPNEWVVTGPRAALQRLARALPRAGRELSVAGAWHSAAMAGARGPLRVRVEALPRGILGAHFVSNADGRVVAADAVPERIVGQLTRPVRWAETMRALAGAGVEDFVTVGPGRTLRALVRKNIGRGVRVRAAETLADLACLHPPAGSPSRRPLEMEA